MAIKLVRIYPVVRIISGARNRPIIACYRKRDHARTHATRATKFMQTMLNGVPDWGYTYGPRVAKYLNLLPNKMLFDPNFDFKKKIKENIMSSGFTVGYHVPEPLSIWRDTDLLNATLQTWRS